MKKKLTLTKKLAQILAAMLVLFAGMNVTVLAQGRGADVVNCNGRLRAIGGNICAEDGTPISLGGMALQWSNWENSYYNRATIDYLVDDFQMSIIRAAVGVAYTPESNGHRTTPVPGGILEDYNGNVAKARAVIDAAVARGIYVIIDWHIEGRAAPYIGTAKQFFEEMARDYGHLPNIIYEVYNEPAHDGNDVGEINAYNQEMVNWIRNFDNDNLIICGSRDWSQNPQEINISDPGNNTCYTFHAYPDNQPGHQTLFDQNVPAAKNMGKAVFITEVGGNFSSHGGCDYIMSKSQEWNVCVTAWNATDDSNPWATFCTNSHSTSCLTDLGGFYRDKLRSWKERTDCGIDLCEDATPMGIPGRIEAEDYCSASGIQLEDCDEGGQNVGFIEAGDFMVYKVNVAAAGRYRVDYRVASKNGSAGLQLEQRGGDPVYGTLAIPNTGDWQIWATESHEVDLQAGVQQIAISAIGDGWNINWFEFTPITTGPVANAGSDQTIIDPDMDGETVTLDGSASTGDIVSYTWTQGGTVIGSGAVITVDMAFGTNNVTLTVVDTEGKSDDDNVRISIVEDQGPNMITNGTFDGDANWSSALYGTASGSVSFNGELNAAIANGGTDAYMVQIIQGGLNIENGVEYTLSFDASAAASRTITANIEKDGSPWTTYGGISPTVGASTQNYSVTFTMNEPTDAAARLAFNLGANNADVVIDNVILSAGEPGNIAPIADAGTDQSLAKGTTAATLDGSGSHDPDNGPSALSYEWTQIDGDAVTISNDAAVNPAVLGLADGNEYTFELVVFDGEDYSIASTVHVTVAAGGPTIVIEAEDFTYAGDIQTETCSEGGLNIGWIDAGDWASYESVNIPAGTYTVEYRVASLNGGGAIQLEKSGGSPQFGSAISVPATGDWQNWTSISQVVEITENTTKLGMAFPAGGINVNWIKLTAISLKAASDDSFATNEVVLYPNPAEHTLFVELAEADLFSNITVIDMTGKVLLIQEAVDTQMMIDVSVLDAGMYMLQVNNTTKRFLKK